VVTKLPAYGRSGIRGPWWSDDRRFVAYGHSGADNTESAALRVWKLDGQTPTVFVDDPEGVNSAAFAFHSGGGKFAVGHVASDVSVYDLDTGKRKKLPVGKVKALAFHPRDDRLAITWGNSVRILDSNTGVVLKRLQSAQMAQEIRCVAWHPDGRRVAMGCRDFKIHVFDADSAAEILPPWDNGSEIETIAFNHSGDLLLSHDWSQETRLWDVATGRALLTTPRDFSADVMTFSADDQYVGFSRVSRDGGKIQVWRLACGREVRALSGSGSGEVLKGRVTDGSGRILAVGFPDRLCFFDTGTGEELATVPVRALPFAFDPAGGWLTGGIRGVMLWRLRSDPGRSGSFRVGPRQLLVSGDGIQVGENPITHDRFTIGVDGLALWPGGPDPRRAGLLSSAPPQPPVSGFGTGLWGFSGASRDGKVLAICESTSAILIHRDRAGRPLTLGPQPGMGSSRVSPDGKWVATFSCWAAGDSKPVRIWDGRDGRHVLDLPLTGALSCGGFSPDGRWLATAENGQSQLWEVGTWRKIRPFPGDFAFSADSQLMAVNDVVGSLRLVKTESGEEVARVTGPELVRYNSLCFTADGTRLIASGKATYVWDLRLIREQLREMGLDWDWPPFPPAVPGTPGRLHLTVDTGSSTQQGSGAAIPRPLEPAPEPDRSK
jgi:WD40 repeat protein